MSHHKNPKPLFNNTLMHFSKKSPNKPHYWNPNCNILPKSKFKLHLKKSNPKKMKKVILSALTLVALASCKKEGCTDWEATNYDQDAKKDNGTCVFESEVSFWMNQQTSDYYYYQDLSDYVTVYVSGQNTGQMPTNLYFDQIPACGQNGTYTTTVNLGSNKSMITTFRIVNEWETEELTKTTTINAGCQLEQIEK